MVACFPGSLGAKSRRIVCRGQLQRGAEVYIENWVFVDMIHLFRQLGVDLFERLAQEHD
jgi:DNA-binding transcriptional MocR family regulator